MRKFFTNLLTQTFNPFKLYLIEEDGVDYFDMVFTFNGKKVGTRQPIETIPDAEELQYKFFVLLAEDLKLAWEKQYGNQAV